jgi:hypothetical protein
VSFLLATNEDKPTHYLVLLIDATLFFGCIIGVAPHVLEFIKGKKKGIKIVTFCSLMEAGTVN